MNVSWSSFYDSFSIPNVQRFVPTTSGIYILWLKLENGKWRCFYVGQASNIKTRLLEHLSTSEQNSNIKTHAQKHVCGFHYVEVGKQSDRDDIERSLYEHYNPECNENEPSGDLIVVNLPQ